MKGENKMPLSIGSKSNVAENNYEKSKSKKCFNAEDERKEKNAKINGTFPGYDKSSLWDNRELATQKSNAILQEKIKSGEIDPKKGIGLSEFYSAYEEASKGLDLNYWDYYSK